jgi:hypothetical protein
LTELFPALLAASLFANVVLVAELLLEKFPNTAFFADSAVLNRF